MILVVDRLIEEVRSDEKSYARAVDAHRRIIEVLHEFGVEQWEMEYAVSINEVWGDRIYADLSADALAVQQMRYRDEFNSALEIGLNDIRFALNRYWPGVEGDTGSRKAVKIQAVQGFMTRFERPGIIEIRNLDEAADRKFREMEKRGEV